MLKTAIQKLIRNQSLTETDMRLALTEMITQCNEAQSAAFLSLLQAKGETTEDIYALVSVMRSMMVTATPPFETLDIVGTGGDGYNTINISTGSALLAASCGVKVAKHGNRSVSSLSGSADVLESLGIQINSTQDEVLASLEAHNFGFFYAPNFHPALLALKKIRTNLAIPTIFNLVGPLLNPAQSNYLMIGIANPSYIQRFTEVLLKSGVKRALLFNGSGLDEISCVDPIQMTEINHHQVEHYTLNPEAFGFKTCTIEDLQGGDSKYNAQLLIDCLKGKPGPISDTLILNAGLAIYLYGLSQSKEQGIAMAKAAHKNGSGFKLIQQLTNTKAPEIKISETPNE